MGKSLEECAEKYKGFCRRYKPKAKPQKQSHWGSKLLAGISLKPKSKKNKSAPGQMKLAYPWDLYQVSESPQVQEVAKKFVRANSYNSE